ncbi:hypothetical protein [Catellatospora sp. NPDC049609]|uniref:AAA family ATPase n=1 Tax=Catellatospora sp. NPDC049609 TaxID=3155505 RepID=UPI0034349FC9
MMIVLVTGVSAAGKSAVSRHLAAHGQQAVSLDGHAGLCDWVDERDRSVPWPSDPDRAWLARHRWVWRADVLDRLIAGAAAGAGEAAVLFLCGRADNAYALRDRFDAVVLLAVDGEVAAQRLDAPERGNPFGRMGDSRAAILDNLDADQRELRGWADAVVDARRPLADVAEEILAATAMLALRRRAA